MKPRRQISAGRRWMAAVLLWGVSTLAGALPFVLTPSVSSVLPGGTFSATLRYDASASVGLDFGLDVTLSALLGGGGSIRLDAASSLHPDIDAPLVSPLLGTLPPDTPLVSSLLIGPIGGAGSTVDLLQFDFTVDAAADPGVLTLMASGQGYDFDLNEIGFSETLTLRIADTPGGQVPEGGTLISLLVGLMALGFCRYRLAQRGKW